MIMLLQITMTAMLIALPCIIFSIINEIVAPNNRLRKRIDAVLDTLTVLTMVIALISGVTFLITTIWS